MAERKETRSDSETGSEKKETSPGRKETELEEDEIRTERKKTNRERKETSPERKDTSPERKKTKSEKKETRSEETLADTSLEMKETNPESKETRPGRKETAPEIKEIIPRKKEVVPKRKETSPERKGTSPERKETVAEGKEIIPEMKEAVSKRKEISPERKETSPERKETVPERKELNSERKEARPERKETSPPRKEPRPGRKETVPEKTEKIPGKNEAVPERKEVSPERKDTSSERKETAPKSNEISSETKETVSEQKEISQERKEAVQEKKETNQEREETSSERKEIDPEKKEISQERKESVPEKKEIIQEREETNPEIKETVPEHKEASQERKEKSPGRKETHPEKKETRAKRKEAKAEGKGPKYNGRDSAKSDLSKFKHSETEQVKLKSSSHDSLDPDLEKLGRILANPENTRSIAKTGSKPHLEHEDFDKNPRSEVEPTHNLNGKDNSRSLDTLVHDDWHWTNNLHLSPTIDQLYQIDQAHHISFETEMLERTDPDIEAAMLQTLKVLSTGDPAKSSVSNMENEKVECERGSQCSGFSRYSVKLSEEGSVEEEYRRRGALGKLLRLIDEYISASVDSKHCLQVFRCAVAVQKEIRRQRQTNRFIIHPYSEFRIAWDVMVVIALLLTMIALPVEIAFYSIEDYHVVTDEGVAHEDVNDHPADDSALHQAVTNEDGHGSNSNETVAYDLHYGPIYEGINLFAEVIFVADILVNFRTGYVLEETDEVILTNKKIIFHYLTTWFIFDLLSAVPFDKIYASIKKNETSDQNFLSIRFARLTKILALLRAFKVFRLLRYIRSLQMIFVLRDNYVEMINLIGITVLVAHWNGCLQYMACFTENYPNFPPDTWIAKEKLQLMNVTVFRRYTRSMLRALSHMLAVGYGQSPPITTAETWVVIASMTYGCIFYALFIAYLASLIKALGHSVVRYKQEIDYLSNFLRFHRVPPALKARILRFFDQKYRGKFFDSGTFLHTTALSPAFQRIFAMHNCRQLVDNITFFQNSSEEFIYEIIKRLEFQVFFPGEYVVRAGSRTQCLVLLAHGKLEVRTNSTTLEKIYEGGYYGEISLMLQEDQKFDVIAVDICDIYLLTKSGFDEVLREFPDIRESLREIAAVRLRRRSKRYSQIRRLSDQTQNPATPE